MTDRKEDLMEGTQKAKSRLVYEAAQYAGMADPLTVSQYLFFRSCVQEAHLYALLDQLATGKMDMSELQKRFIDHADRIASELQARRSTGKIVTPGKA